MGSSRAALVATSAVLVILLAAAGPAGAIFNDTAGVDWIASIVAAIVLVLLWRAVSGNRDTAIRS